ncbi:hypothetical protein AX16_006768 [Volvariella volvacea WC 439]|nr:hypothetical protein AX16_006768 [Volvariella volvacea WC 439]
MPLTAGIKVTRPESNSACVAGQECVIEWMDDGRAPLLNAFGLATVGLYTGDQQLVQALPPVDVSATRSVSFVPIAEAGPNSGAYYISFVSVNLRDEDDVPAMGFSPYFRLQQMTGSFETPVSHAISTFPLPTETSQTSLTSTSTITVGTLSTSLPVPSESSIISGSVTASELPSASDSVSSSPSGSLSASESASDSGSTSLSHSTSHSASESSESPSVSPSASAIGVSTSGFVTSVSETQPPRTPAPSPSSQNSTDGENGAAGRQGALSGIALASVLVASLVLTL